MPHYRATLAHNVRAYRHARFEAASDEEAIAKALTLNEWDQLDTDDNDFDDADVGDQIIMLDQVDATTQLIGVRTVEDEIGIPNQMPYGRGARDLVQALAVQRLPLDTGETADRLRAFIERARELCGLNDRDAIDG